MAGWSGPHLQGLRPTKKPAWSAGFLANDEVKTDYFLSIVALSSLVGFFVVLVFFVVLFIAFIELWSVPVVAPVWLPAAAPGCVSVEVCADAAAMADRPMTAAQTDVSMVFRMDGGLLLKRSMQNRAASGLFLFQANG
jgi:hypothetical protein